MQRLPPSHYLDEIGLLCKYKILVHKNFLTKLCSDKFLQCTDNDGTVQWNTGGAHYNGTILEMKCCRLTEVKLNTRKCIPFWQNGADNKCCFNQCDHTSTRRHDINKVYGNMNWRPRPEIGNSQGVHKVLRHAIYEMLPNGIEIRS